VTSQTAPAPTDQPRPGSVLEKGGGGFAGLSMLLCENPLPPLPVAVEAAARQLPHANLYTEPYSGPLRRLLAQRLDVPERLIHVNAGSELILRQLFDRFGQQVHLLTPTYPLFPTIARSATETRLAPADGFAFDLADLVVPDGTTLVTLVNPNNPTGTVLDMAVLPAMLRRHRSTMFLVDEAFIGLAGQPVVHLVPDHPNLIVTRTLSKAHSLAGFRVGYAIASERVADDLNTNNDAYPLTRGAQAAAIATLEHEDQIAVRARMLRGLAQDLAAAMRELGVRTFPSQTYFFLADVSPADARSIAEQLRERDILVRPLDDPRLGPGYMRITTSLPDRNTRFLWALRASLATR
jgi:histidinol-phosphate aminotransferase